MSAAQQFKVGDRASQVARYMALTTCPHCGRDLDGEELATGLCTSDDCPRHDADLYSLSFDELHAIAVDVNHPQREEANDLLDQWQADAASRRTSAGGEA